MPHALCMDRSTDACVLLRRHRVANEEALHLRAARNLSRSGHSAAVTTSSVLTQLWPALCARPVAT